MVRTETLLGERHAMFKHRVELLQRKLGMVTSR